MRRQLATRGRITLGSLGVTAKTSVNQLAQQLTTGRKTIESAIQGASGTTGVLTAVSTVSSTLVTLSTGVSSTVTKLQQLDPKGELQQAFKDADSCAPLLSS